MAYRTCGNEAIDRPTSHGGGLTQIELLVPISNRGILKEVSVYTTGGAAFKIKVFRDDGVNYVFVGEQSVTAAGAGLSVFGTWIAVEVGDLIGFYILAANVIDSTNPGGVMKTKAGDVTTTTAKAGWADGAHITSLFGKVFTKVGAI